MSSSKNKYPIQTIGRKKKLKHINRFLKATGSNNSLPRRLQYQHTLLKYIRSLLPDQLKKHCLASVHRDNEFTVFTDTSVWASRLRFFSRDLLAQVRLTYPQTNKINIRIMHQYSIAPIRKKSTSTLILSEKNARLIRITAEHINDPDLKIALQKLAKHTP